MLTRNHWLGVIAVFTQLIWGSGCISPSYDKLPAELISNTRKVGLLNQTSPIIHGELAATTAFANDEWEAQEQRLKTGDIIFAAASEAASANVVRIEDARLDGIRPIYKPRNLILMPGKLGPDIVRQIGHEADVDLLLIFSSAWCNDSFEMTSAAFPSQGIFSRRFLSQERNYAYFASHIEIYDTRSGKLVKVNWCSGGTPLSTPLNWRNAWHDYPADQQMIILEAVSDVTSSAVKRSILVLGL